MWFLKIQPPSNRNIFIFTTFVLFLFTFSASASNMCGYTTSFLTLLLIYYHTLLAHGACYNPDQSVPSKPYSPCDTAIGVHSACCATGDQCTENGYCLGNANYVYRGGCTDISWQSSNCAQECRHGTQLAHPQDKCLLLAKLCLTS